MFTEEKKEMFKAIQGGENFFNLNNETLQLTRSTGMVVWSAHSGSYEVNR